MKKHGVIIDMTNNFLVFWPGYYIYIGAISPTTPSQPRLPMETAVVRIEKYITAQKIIKKGLKEDMNNFLQTTNKIFSKKKRQINKSKRKTSIEETSSKKLLLAV